MPLNQSPYLSTKRIKSKGRGVIAREFIPADTEIERVPLLIIDTESIETSMLMDYVYCWTDTTVALALGYGSLYNHSFNPNAVYEDEGQRTKVFRAIRDIQPGEEITINYNADPEDKTPVDFDVLE